jgi:hypothetical protein
VSKSVIELFKDAGRDPRALLAVDICILGSGVWRLDDNTGNILYLRCGEDIREKMLNAVALTETLRNALCTGISNIFLFNKDGMLLASA